ncbi:MAG: hypothetical protein DGJ47_000058 [Rickettsiaceae bacterium]
MFIFNKNLGNKMKLKDYILTTAASLVIFGSSAYALDTTEDGILTKPTLNMDLNGYAHFQAGYRNQDHLAKSENNISKNNDKVAFFNEAALAANIYNQVNDVTYGAKIVLSTTSRRKNNNDFNGTHIYVKTDYGKVELGSSVSPASTMIVEAGCITAGTGNYGRYSNKSSEFQKQNDGTDPSANKLSPTFATGIDLFLSDKLLTKLDSRTYSGEAPRSIIYYSPKFDLAAKTKVRIGVAYTPDSTNTGADNIDTASSGLETKKIGSSTIDRFEFDNTVKNALSGAVAVSRNFADGVDLEIGLSGEYGQAIGFAKEFANEGDTTPVAEHKLKDLRSYNIGAVLNYGNFAYGASYGSLGDSLTTEAYHKAGRKTKYYTAAIAYSQGPASVSVDYYRADKFKNTTQAVTVGTSYKLYDGFKPYFEVTRYEYNGKPEFYPTTEKRKVVGTAVITGLKLSL